MAEARIQPGVYFAEGVRPKSHFLVTFVAVDPGTGAHAVLERLQRLWNRLQALRTGIVADLPGVTTPDGELDVLIGYGMKAFSIAEVTLPLPPELAKSNTFMSPRSTGGGPLLIGSGINYAADLTRNPATEEIVLQFTANSALAVRRAYVETARELGRDGPLRLAAPFDGFSRDDGRSWLGFHDGLSNMHSGDERHDAIRVKAGPFVEGTTLVFMRLVVDLDLWDRLSTPEQEIVVGRSKLSGCPLVDVSASGEPIVAPGCPVSGAGDVTRPGNELFREPPLGVSARLKQSHVHRANFAHNQSTGDPGSLRVFRQGYEFLESAVAAPNFRLGLNFVSFQDTPARLISLLTRNGWLGNVNFGGGAANDLEPGPSLLTCRAAGVYLVPPLGENGVLPGAEIFSVPA